jgi:hypothetical protein
LIQTLPPQHRGLLPVRCSRVLRDHPGPVLRRERPAHRLRRRIDRPRIMARTPGGPNGLNAAAHRTRSPVTPYTVHPSPAGMSHLSLAGRVAGRLRDDPGTTPGRPCPVCERRFTPGVFVHRSARAGCPGGMSGDTKLARV